MANNGDRRSVATDALETLGTIIDDTQKRDAIHLAVEPVTAGETLRPGDHITVRDGIARKSPVGIGLGIVDPFLIKPVKKGQKFWFVMYPRMVHSLRHVWTHPDFPDEIIELVSKDHNKQASELWLRKFCQKADCPDYEILMELIDKGSLPSPDPKYYSIGGRYDSEFLTFFGSDAHGQIPPEFWDHAEIVLGRKLTQRPEYFSCSC